ncbi:MAG: ATP-binding cassette domain-containing protein [Bacilli bacterium]
MNAISIRNFEKSYDKYRLTIESLDIPKGYVTGFIGKNGAGKTTTLESIVGLLPVEKGTITLHETASPPYKPEMKTRFCFMGENSGYFQFCTLKDLRNMIAPFFPKWNEEKYQRLLTLFEIDEMKVFKELSTGMQKLFTLASLLARETELIILDEPTANLDPSMRQKILDVLFDEMTNPEKTIFFSTHITSDLEKIADYICFLDEGHIRLFEEKDTLLERHRIVKGKKELLNEGREMKWIGVREHAYGFTALTDNFEEARAFFGDELTYEYPTIEDIFVYYTKREE